MPVRSETVRSPRDLRHLVRRDDRKLPLVADLGAARIPGLAPAGAPRRPPVEIVRDAVEAQLQRLDRLRLEAAGQRGIGAGDLAQQLARRDDLGKRAGLGEQVEHQALQERQ